MQEFFFDKENGRVIQKKLIERKLDELQDGSWKCSFKPGKRRSNRANRYYWGCVMRLVYEGLRDAGFEDIRDEDDAHEVCKSLFLRQEAERNGIKIWMPGSTKKLTTREFWEYVEHIIMWAYDYLNTTIPPPNTQTDFNFMYD